MSTVSTATPVPVVSGSATSSNVSVMLMGQAIAARAAEVAASQASNPIAAIVAGHKASAETLYAFLLGVEAGTGRQCLVFPGEGNGSRYFNYETFEWEESC